MSKIPKPTDDMKLPDGIEELLTSPCFRTVYRGWPVEVAEIEYGWMERLRAEIAAALEKERQARTHCEDCGLTWLDDGLNPFGCPYCFRRTAEARVRELEAELHASVRVFRDGTAWCALVGPDLQEGVARFAATPADALAALAEQLAGQPWPEDDAARQAGEVE